MSGRIRLRGRFQLLVALVVPLVQLPAVLWLCWVTRSPLPAAIALLVSVPYPRQPRSPWHTTAPAVSTYLALGW